MRRDPASLALAGYLATLTLSLALTLTGVLSPFTPLAVAWALVVPAGLATYALERREAREGSR